jgi:AraC-like DNA-binding protein
MSILLDANTVAPHERFDFWVESSHKVFYPATFHEVKQDRTFKGLVNQFLLGPMSITRVTSTPTNVERTRRDVASHDPDLIHLSMQLRGCSIFSQDGHSTTVSAGEMVLLDTSRPLQVVTPVPYDLVVLECSRHLLGVHGVDLRTARPLHSNVARTLVAPFVTRLAQGLADGTLSESDTDLGESALYLLRALCADGEDPREAGRRQAPGTMLSRLKVHIEEHLSDPDLRPDQIAGAHYISTRYLQKLFKAEGLTVTDWIRERRLAACRRDLRDPDLADQTILTIASRWGLTNPAHFSRSFRAVYGCTPSEYRAMEGSEQA